MEKETVIVNIENYCIDFAEECINAIEYRIEHDCLDAVKNRLRQHGYVKERTCKMMEVHGDDGYTFICSECNMPISYFARGKYCLNCGARVIE